MNAQTILEQLRNAKSKMDEANNSTEEAISLIRETMIEARSNLGFSAEKFGKLCGITTQYVFRIEAGKAHWREDCLNAFISNMEGENAK